MAYPSRLVKNNDPIMGAMILHGSQIGAMMMVGDAFVASLPRGPVATRYED